MPLDINLLISASFPSKPTLDALLEHARATMPRESCGLILNARGHERYVPCQNLSEDSDGFVLDPLAYIEAEERGELLAIVHSHPYAPPEPSQADLVGCEQSGLPWLIVSVPTGRLHLMRPTGYKADYIGRQFRYGVLDCYSLVRDWYREELRIELPAPPEAARSSTWWKGPNASELYLEGYAAAGFERVDPPEPGDVILMQVQSDVANHAGIYLGDQVLLHHVWGRLSCRETYGGYWFKHTRAIVRHHSRA